jgi:hypothetical protein
VDDGSKTEAGSKSRLLVPVQKESAAQLCQEVGWVDGLGEDFEFVALRAGLFKQIGGSGLA